MRTRSTSYLINSNATIPRRSNRRRVPNIVEPEIRTIEEVVPMADRTMEELLQAPTEGYGEAIVIPEILTENFKIKTNLLQLVQTNKFHGFERDNPHTHISNFKRMTSTLKYRDVPDDAINLMLFPYSLEGAARIWYEKEPPNSILTWDDLVNKFVDQFFPPFKTTHLKNEISRFTQRFEETFGEAWECFKEMLRACPHHGFSELTQIYTFYNGLNEQDQGSLNAAAGGNLLSKTTREALKIIKNKSKVRYSRRKSNVSRVNTNSRDSASKIDDRIDKLADQISNLVEIVNNQVFTPATAKAVEKTCVICGGAHSYYDCIAIDSNQPSVCAATSTYNQVSLPNRASHQIPPPGFALVQNNPSSFFQNQASTLGTLLSNIVPNPKGEMKVVTTRSGLAYEGPSIHTNSSLDKVVERDTKEATNKEHSNYQGSTTHIQPSVVPISILEPDVPRTQPKPTIPYPSRLNDQKLRIDVCHALPDLGASINLMPLSIWKKAFTSRTYPAWMTLELADRSITRPKGVAEDLFVKVGKFYFYTDFVVVDFEVDLRVPLILGRSFLRTGRALIDVSGEEITLRYNPKSRNPTLVSNPESESCKEPIVKSSSPTLTPFGEKETKAKSLIGEPPELELKELPSHLEYAFLEESDKLLVIIAKDLKDVEKEALIKVLKSHKRAIAWKIFDIKGYKIWMSGIEVDRAKVDVIAKLPHPTTVKGSENLAADHLSRLENPHKDVLENKEINENFPLETLGSLSSAIDILKACHEGPTGGHHGANLTAKKIFDAERTVGENHASWSDKLDDALWAFRTPIGCTPYKMVYGKPCHLPIELEHIAYWALKHVNFDLKTAGDHRKLQLNELNELRDQAYENSLIYKERTKKMHDSKIKNRIFNVELSQPNGPNFKVNGHRVKHYFGGDILFKLRNAPGVLRQDHTVLVRRFSNSNGSVTNRANVAHHASGDNICLCKSCIGFASSTPMFTRSYRATNTTKGKNGLAAKAEGTSVNDMRFTSASFLDTLIPCFHVEGPLLDVRISPLFFLYAWLHRQGVLCPLTRKRKAPEDLLTDGLSREYMLATEDFDG
uniref:Reverse transcriptase domain-containing protein n=1 Tax=Tanacetum cinerariifolium TaxID=118510 RepID=A0A6L2KP00_TANCI|nr:reverse transcriptase domain-containing protein [Tanacetum cinerariifolium]